MGLRYPDFLCIGAQKCGTTWLYANLKRQAGIAMPEIKELQYFNEIWLPHQREWTQSHRRGQALAHVEWYVRNVPRAQWDAGHLHQILNLGDAPISDAWYGAVFAALRDDALVGEITPEYALLPLKGFQHILQLNADMKLILLVRDPIERAWSHVKMMARIQGRACTVPTALQLLDYQEIKQRSDYYATISVISEAGAGANLHVESIDAIQSDPKRALETICDFIGLPAGERDLGRAGEHIHVGAPDRIPPELVAPMREKFATCYSRFETFAPDLVRRWRERAMSAA